MRFPSGICFCLLPKLNLKPSFYLGPLCFDDAKADRITVTAARHDHVIAENAFLFCSKTQDCRPRLLIQNIGHELNANASQALKRVGEKQQLCFGIHAGALGTRRQPRKPRSRSWSRR